MIELTSQKIEELLKKGKSRNGGWSNKQLACLGVSAQEKVYGWKHRLVGKEISEAKAEEFIRLKDAHLSARVEEHEVFGYSVANAPVTQTSAKQRGGSPAQQRVFILTNAKGNTIIDAYTTFQKAEDARAELIRQRPSEDYNVWGCKVIWHINQIAASWLAEETNAKLKNQLYKKIPMHLIKIAAILPLLLICLFCVLLFWNDADQQADY